MERRNTAQENFSSDKDSEYGARVRALRKKPVDEIILQLDQIPILTTSTDESSHSAATRRRVLLELRMLTQNSEGNEYAWIVPSHGFRHLLAVIQGPAGTPYEDGLFWIECRYPADYPISPPAMRMITKIYHPNIEKDGTICAGMLSFDWSPVQILEKLLISLAAIVGCPILDDPLVPDVAARYIKNYEEYERVARQWTEEYAQAESVQRSDLRYV